MSNHDAETKSTNPGASRHGNFINYYQFHSVEERVRQLPLEICQSAKNNDGKFVALDVGCNAGNLTLELYEFLKKNLPNREIVILGIDIDPILIVRARELIADRDPLLPITFENLDFLSNDREKIVTAFLEKHQVSYFDVSFCFSITMWVHLNNGDEGLEKFLRDVCTCSKTVLIEPQPWKCYARASRRMRRANQNDFKLLKELKYREDVEEQIEKLIEQQKFRRIALTEPNDWQRRLLYYERQ